MAALDPLAAHPDDVDDVLDALDRADALRDANTTIVAGLLGVALGAGLGWLASRAVAAPERARAARRIG